MGTLSRNSFLTPRLGACSMRIRDNIRGHTRVSRIRISSSRSLSDDSKLGSGQGRARQGKQGLDWTVVVVAVVLIPQFFSLFSLSSERDRFVVSLCDSCLHSSIYSIQWLVLVLSCKALSCLRALFLCLRLLGSWYQYCAQARPSIRPSHPPSPSPSHPISFHPIQSCHALRTSTNLHVWRGVA